MKRTAYCWLVRTCASLAALLVAANAASQLAADETLLGSWPEDAATSDESFDGSRFAVLPAAANVDGGPFSVSVWVQAADLAGGAPEWGRGIARSTRGDKVGDWVLSVHPDGRVRFFNWRKAGIDESGSHLTTHALILTDEWCHIAATWDGTVNRIYVNGVEAEHGALTTGSGWETGHEVGRSWTQGGYYWSGAIGQLRVWRRAVSPEEVAASVKLDSRSQPPAPPQPTGDAAVSAAIDREILAKLQAHQFTPAPPADDAEFLRRVTLDLAGRIPTVAETQAFLANESPEKRHRRIDELLSGRELPLYWSQVLSNWLMPPAGRRDEKFISYLRGGMAKNKPWDAFVREMLIARPSGSADQYASYFLSYRKEALKDNSIARDVGRALLGVNLRCAQCHDHPHVTEWTNERFYALSAFFARSFEHAYTDKFNQQLIAIGEKATGELEYAAADGGKKIAVPKFLDGTPLAEPDAASLSPEPALAKDAPPPAPAFSRREALAGLALDPESPYVKRAMVNRVWRTLMGRGLVEPVDMLHKENPPTHPELLDLLAHDFADHGYDLRRLIAVIAKSQAYARSSRWTDSGEPPDEQLYAAAVLKPLDADQIALSLPLATGYYDDQLEGALKRSMAQIRPAAPWKELLAEFDADPETFEPTATQALFLLNSDYVQKNMITGSRLAQQLGAVQDDAELARRAHLAILSRLPTADETEQVAQYLASRKDQPRTLACEELIWAMSTGAEFRFNH